MNHVQIVTGATSNGQVESFMDAATLSPSPEDVAQFDKAGGWRLGVRGSRGAGALGFRERENRAARTA